VELLLHALLFLELDRCEWPTSRFGRFIPGEGAPPLSIRLETGLAPESVWTGWEKKKALFLPRIEPRPSSP
jgi:hypothetical protein